MGFTFHAVYFCANTIKMYIDSHCHLNHGMNGEGVSPEQLIKQANDNNVIGLQTICCRMHEEYELLTSIADAHDNVWCSVGTHPHDVSVEAEKAYSVDDIVALSKHDKVIGIGESGLDYFYDHADREDQKVSFRKHIQACQESGLPLIVHSRDADDDCISIIKQEIANSPKPLTGVLHCFSSGEAMAMEALDFGFYISFSGMVTFKKMDWLREIVRKVPQDRILIETDAPFLAPMPYRGKTNQPAYVEYVALELAEIHDLTREEMGQVTMDNFFRLFPKAKNTWVEPR
jgi:TatD DNase family protein